MHRGENYSHPYLQLISRMRVRMNIEKNTLFKINNIFFYSIINPAVRDEIGFKSISGLSKDRGWYIWLNQSAGVYDLFTLACENKNCANFLLKYYPSVSESIYELYSDQEKSLRNQYPFDKGVPKQDVRDEKLVEYFNIGHLDLLWEDHLIWLHLAMPDNNNQNEGSTVPLLQLSYTLYSHLIRAICYFTKNPPSLVLMRKSYIPQLTNTSDELIQEPKPIAIRQFTCALLPNVKDKDSEIAELCHSMGINNTHNGEESLGNEPWQPLYIEDQTKTLPAFSHLLDEMWWKLPAKAEAILTKELAI